MAYGGKPGSEGIRADLERVKRYERKYETYYNQVLVKEEPFYRMGMTRDEADKEMEYLNLNLQEFYEGRYIPLWRQRWFS